MGKSGAFVVSVVVILIWLGSGPYFHFSDTWQLVVNTATSVITFLMVFLIQNAQARDTRAIQLKLDELLRAAKHARNDLVHLEELSDEELDCLREDFARLAKGGTSLSETRLRDAGSGGAASGDKRE